MTEGLNISNEGKAIARAIKSILAKAKAAGVARPSVFFESEGTLHVMDGDKLDAAGSTAKRQSASVASYFVDNYDCGAW